MLALAGVVFALVLTALLGAPASASETSCVGTSCGVPECWEPAVRLRPDMARTVGVSCSRVTSAKLLTPPEYSDVSDVSIGNYRFEFVARPHDDAPRFDEAVFELTGPGGTIEQRVRLEVVPRDENSPPVCDGDQVTERTDGSAPADVFMHPYCRDPDGDDFVMEGGPPGVHPEAPKHVLAGLSESNWMYRTATSNGTETATIWATDSLGARSADAELKVTVGPGIDQLPNCTPSSYSSYGGVMNVNMRPGKTRGFSLTCTDPDGDLFASRLSTPPKRGALAFVEGEPYWNYSGLQRSSVATYVPLDDGLEPDPFGVTATGLKGDGPEAQIQMVPREPPYNEGGSCGWWGNTEVLSPAPGLLRAGCEDDEDDPFTVEVVTEPKHGTLGPVTLTHLPSGYSSITAAYVPDVGYEGYDCAKLRIYDPYGLEFTPAFDIWVRPPVEVEPPGVPDPPTLPDPPVDPPTLPDPPVDPPTVPDPPVVPDTGQDQGSEQSQPEQPQEQQPEQPQQQPEQPQQQPDQPDPPEQPPLEPPQLPPDLGLPIFPTPPPGPPSDPDSLPSAQSDPIPPTTVPTNVSRAIRPAVEKILGTRRVARVRRYRGVQVWARSRLPRRALLKQGQAPGVVVVCSTDCRIRDSAVLAAGKKPIRESRLRSAAAVSAGEPHVLTLTLGADERRMLLGLRKPRAKFRLSVRPTGRRATLVKRSIRIGP